MRLPPPPLVPSPGAPSSSSPASVTSGRRPRRPDKGAFEAFEGGLAELGYVPGKTIDLEPRFADGQEERLAALARGLVDLKLDVIVTGGQGVLARTRRRRPSRLSRQ